MTPTTNPEPTEASILLVDDLPANLIVLEAVLAPLGHRTARASSGAEALQRIAEQEFAVVLLDIQMPGMDGFQTAESLHQDARVKHVPVIFLTAGHSDAWNKKAYAHHAVDYIAKPFDPDILRAKVRVFVELHLAHKRLGQQEAKLRDNALATARAVAEREAAEAASSAKDDFLAMVSHELRTPLSAILGYGEMLRGGRLETDAQRAKAVETICKNARLQAQLIEDLLDLSRIVAGNFTVERTACDLVPALRSAVDALRPQAEAAGVNLLVELPDEAPLQGDPTRLQQVAWNLLANALKFTRRGGHVSLTVRDEASEHVISVRDDGRGIPPDFLPNVFDRFAQGSTRSPGLGLGLAIVRHIVELHGGSVEAKSEGEGRGATFVARLPHRATDGAVLRARDFEHTGASTGRWNPLPRAGAPETLAGLHILLVDDEADALELLDLTLRQAGARTTRAGSAADAAARVAEHRFDLVISDLGMPDEDGFSLARRISARATLPAIALSALSTVDAKERALEAGFITHVSKPYDGDRLVSLVARLAKRG